MHQGFSIDYSKWKRIAQEEARGEKQTPQLNCRVSVEAAEEEDQVGGF